MTAPWTLLSGPARQHVHLVAAEALVSPQADFDAVVSAPTAQGRPGQRGFLAHAGETVEGCQHLLREKAGKEKRSLPG